MIRPTTMALMLAAGATAPALAQVPGISTVRYMLNAVEAPGSNSNGVLDPGESLLLQLSMSFTNQNLVVNIPPWGLSTIRGFGSSFFDIHVSGSSTAGIWNTDPTQGYGVHPSWDISSQEGTQVGADLVDIETGQFPLSPSLINTSNPVVNIWQGLWTPASYDPRSLTFQTAPNPVAGNTHTSVLLVVPIGGGLVAGDFDVDARFGSAQFQIVPDPPVPGVLIGLLLIRRRRRRRG